MTQPTTPIGNLVDLDLFNTNQNQQRPQSVQIPNKVISKSSDEISHDDCGCSGMCCKKISHHISDCDICTQIYNNDKTVYIVIIAILLVIIAVLCKKAFSL